MNMCSRVMKYIQTRDDAFINLVRESLETHLKALLRHLKNAIGQACSSRVSFSQLSAVYVCVCVCMCVSVSLCVCVCVCVCRCVW